MAKNSARIREVVLPEYIPENLGAPFKVVLKDSVKQVYDSNTGKVLEIVIPNPRGLLQTIAVTRLLWSRKLSGAEIKFIRKALRIKSGHLAAMIEVSPEHLSRCESGERVLSPGVEKCLRVVVLLDALKLPDDFDENCAKSDEVKSLIDKYEKILSRLKSIMTRMSISSVSDAEEPLVLTFSVSKGDAKSTEQEAEEWNELTALAA